MRPRTILAARSLCASMPKRSASSSWRILGEIAARRSRLSRTCATRSRRLRADECVAARARHWEKVIDEDELSPSRSRARPSAGCAAIRRRRRSASRSCTATIAPGISFSTRRDGSAPSSIGRCAISAIRSRTSPGRSIRCGLAGSRAAGGSCLPRERGARDFGRRRAALKADRRALSWWAMFASVKGLAIWISSGREFADGRNQDPILALASWFPTDVHDRVLVERLAPEVDRS